MEKIWFTREAKAILSAADRNNRRYVFDSVLVSQGSIMATTGRIAARRPIRTEGEPEEALIRPEFLKGISPKKGDPVECARGCGKIYGEGPKGQHVEADLGDPRDFPGLRKIMDRYRKEADQDLGQGRDRYTIRVGAPELLALIKALGPIDAKDGGSFDILPPPTHGDGIFIRRRTSEGKLEGAEGLIMPIIIDNPHE